VLAINAITVAVVAIAVAVTVISVAVTIITVPVPVAVAVAITSVAISKIATTAMVVVPHLTVSFKSLPAIKSPSFIAFIGFVTFSFSFNFIG
jgi:hypothetical protein